MTPLSEAVRNAHTAWNARLYSRAALLVAPLTHVTDHGRGRLVTSRAGYHRWLVETVETASNVQVRDARYLEGAGWVTAMYRLAGTQDGPLGEWPATHEHFSLDVCETWHFDASGQAVEGHLYYDLFKLLAGLGHLLELA